MVWMLDPPSIEDQHQTRIVEKLTELLCEYVHALLFF